MRICDWSADVCSSDLSENVLLEVVDDDGRPCRPGEIGRVLITSLHNFATPLSSEALIGLVDAFVLQEGTDSGPAEPTLPRTDRTSDVRGTRVSAPDELRGCRFCKKQKIKIETN